MNTINKNRALQKPYYLSNLESMTKQPYYIIVRAFQFDELYQIR